MIFLDIVLFTLMNQKFATAWRRLYVAVSAVAFSVATASATLSPADINAVSSDYYKAITFTWTDAQGNTHESNLTEEATDPNHIVALLREVYVNPKVPGYTCDMAADQIQDGRQQYATVKYEPCTLPPSICLPIWKSRPRCPALPRFSLR